MWATVDASCPWMPVPKLLFCHAIINQTMSKKESGSRTQEAKFTELKLLQKQRVVLGRKIYMFRDLWEHSLDAFLFLGHLETLKLKEQFTEEILMLLFANLKSKVSSSKIILISSWSVAMEYLNNWIISIQLKLFGIELPNKPHQNNLTIYLFKMWVISQAEKETTDNSTMMNISQLQKA